MENIERAIAENKLQEAEKLCDNLLKKSEYDITGLYYKAIILRKQEKLNLALEIQNTLINLLPRTAEYYAERGLTYHYLKENKAALEDFNKALELDSDNPYRYSSRAFIKDYYGDHQGAVEDYRKAVELDPEDAIALNNLGIIEEKMGRLDQAQENFKRSDRLTGVEQSLNDLGAKISPESAGAVARQNAAKTTGWSNFIATLKSLFTSSKERRAFFRFLLGKK
jgi:tetratricopeptide (TPR) repeat protein